MTAGWLYTSQMLPISQDLPHANQTVTDRLYTFVYKLIKAEIEYGAKN